MNTNQTLSLKAGSGPVPTGTDIMTASNPTIKAGSSVRQARRLILTLVVALAAMMGLGAPQASAWSVTGADSYGGVTSNGVNVFSQYYRTPGALYGSTVAHLYVRGPRATRSNGWSGVQRIEYTFVVQKAVNGAWVNVYHSAAQSANVAPGSYVTFNDMTVRVGDPLVFTGAYYRVNFVVTWKDAYLRYLGIRAFASSLASDYSCSINCTRGPGWVYV